MNITGESENEHTKIFNYLCELEHKALRILEQKNGSLPLSLRYNTGKQSFLESLAGIRKRQVASTRPSL